MSNAARFGCHTPIRRTVCAFTLILFLTPLWAASQAHAALDEPGQAAAQMIREVVTPRRAGAGAAASSALLQSLRRLRDPELKPLYDYLAQTPDPLLQPHGILGLMDLHPAHQLDLNRLALIADKQTQATIVSAALDTGDLSLEQAQQMLQWNGLTEGTRILVSMMLLKHQKLESTDFLRSAAASPPAGKQALANLLLAQMGDAQALAAIDALLASEDERLPQTLTIVFETILKYRYDKLGPFSLKASQSAKVPAPLQLVAMRTALQCGAPGAEEAWRKRYAAGDLAAKTRLSLIAMTLAQDLRPEFFSVVTQESDPSLKQIGLLGEAIAKKQVTPAVVQPLLESGQPVVMEWALRFCREQAEAGTRDALLELVIDLARKQAAPTSASAEDRRRLAGLQGRKLQMASIAFGILCEKSPEKAEALGQPLLAAPQADEQLTIALLLGLVQMPVKPPAALLGSLPASTLPSMSPLVTLLRARHEGTLSEEARRELAVLARGGGALPETLRIQAAWLYLKHSGQVPAGLALATGRP